MFSRAIILLASLLLVQPADAAEKVDWVNVKCCGTDISVGKDGSAWLVGTDKRLYQWDGRNWAQDPQAQGVVRVAVAPDGTPWITNTNSDIWTRADGRWRKVHGKASDIAVGADGTVWTLGRKGAIYKRVGDRWQRISGKARRIAVDPKGNAWVINAGGAVDRFDGSKFVKLPGGNGQDIGIGAEGTAWLTTGKNNVYKWNGRAWILHTGKLTAISAGPDGNPWGLAATRKVFTAKSALASVAAAAKKRRNDDLLEPLKQHYPEAIAAIDPRRLRDEGTHLEAEHEIFGQKAGIVIYTPKGKRLPNIAFTFNKVDVNAVLDGLNKPNLMPLALEDLTLFLVPPGNGQDGVTPGQLPKILKQPVENVYKLAGSILPAKFDLEPGVNFLSRADASKRPDVNSLFGLIGLDATDDLTITGRLQRLAIKKHKAWKEPFGQKDMTIEKATILVITTNIADFFGTAAGAAIDRTRFAKPHYRNIAIWGNTNVKGRDYLVYGQQAYLRPSPKTKHKLIGTAYGFDAAAMTLGDMINLAKLLPWTRVMPLPPTGKMPLDIVTFTNPNHRPYNAVSYGVPPFTDMILVSATKGVTIPDGKPLPGSKGIPDAKKLSNGLRGTPGPLMYVNGGVELAGRELGNGDFSLSARGLEGAVTGAAGMTLGKMLGETVKLESGGSFTIEINNSKQLIALTSKTSAANFAKQDASITFTPKGGASCSTWDTRRRSRSTATSRRRRSPGRASTICCSASPSTMAPSTIAPAGPSNSSARPSRKSARRSPAPPRSPPRWRPTSPRRSPRKFPAASRPSAARSSGFSRKRRRRISRRPGTATTTMVKSGYTATAPAGPMATSTSISPDRRMATGSACRSIPPKTRTDRSSSSASAT